MQDKVIREQLADLLKGGKAHLPVDNIIRSFPLQHINSYAENIPYTAWQLLEHLRIAQWDILEFIRNPEYQSPEWPSGYWPDRSHQATEPDWTDSFDAFRADLKALLEMVSDPAIDLTAPLAHASDYNILREMLLVADHNAYHIGQLIVIKRSLGLWTDSP